MQKQVLIGGQALVQLGSDRSTNDIDFLIFDKTNKEVFITSEKVDYLNAANNKFFNKIWENEKNNEVASPESLLELKAYSFVQHCQNMNWQKVANTEYDMKFLVLKFGLSLPTIVKSFVSAGEYSEIEKIINFNK